MRISQVSTLFEETVRTMNESLLANAETPFARSLRARLDAAFTGRMMGVSAYEREPKFAVDHFAVAYHQGRFRIVDRAHSSGPIDWHVPVFYLEQVVENPTAFINDLGRLDWHWVPETQE